MMATFMTGYRSWRALGCSRHKWAYRPLWGAVIADPDCSDKQHNDQASKHINHYPTQSTVGTTVARINPKSILDAATPELPRL
jgi:nitrite reductase/ring-hydroxylating ferredoxin subunit